MRTGFGPIFPAALWRSKVLAPIDSIAANAERSIMACGNGIVWAGELATGHPLLFCSGDVLIGRGHLIRADGFSRPNQAAEQVHLSKGNCQPFP